MSSTINASSAGIVETADSSGTLQLQTGGQTGVYIDASQNVTIPKNLTISGTLTYSGGAGVTSISGGSTGLTYGSGTGTVTTAGTLLYSSGGTGLTGSGSSGNLLVSTGSGWTSSSLATAGIAPATGSSVYAPLASPALTGTVTVASHLYVTATPSSSGSAFYSQANSSGISVAGTFDCQYTGGVALDCLVANTSSYLTVFSYGTVGSASPVGSITTNGTSTTYGTSSDRRLKSNIVSLTDASSKIDALQPRTFTWNSTSQTDIGFIADEIQSILPNSVHGQANAVDADNNPKYQMVDVSTPEMIALMVCELQSLRKRVAALEAKVGA